MYDKNRAHFKQYKPEKHKFEIVAARGNITGLSRSVVVLAFYLPPSTNVENTKEIIEFIIEIIERAKIDEDRPYIILGVGMLIRTSHLSSPTSQSCKFRKPATPEEGNNLTCLSLI